MKISFVWDWEPEFYQSVTWRDGLAAAIKELMNRGHEIQVLCAGKERNVINNPYFDIQASTDIKKDVSEFGPDVILIWGDMTRPNIGPLKSLGKPLAICFAGGETFNENTNLFDHIFVESEVYKKRFEEKGLKVSTAFGTNTELFKPIQNPKLFDTIFPATFATWKRHELYAKSVEGLRNLAVGYIYNDHEQECWQICLDRGVTIMPHVSAEALRYLYAASKVCVIPSLSSGGSQRTVLEAMSMNLPLIITDSDKFDFARGKVFESEPDIPSIRGMVDAAMETEVNTRDYVVENWSEFTYADALEKGLREIV